MSTARFRFSPRSGERSLVPTVRDGVMLLDDEGGAPMSEPEGRANHEHGSFSFLATQWRALIGADPFATGVMWPKTREVRQ